MTHTFTLLLPVFAIIACGYLLSKHISIQPRWVKVLNLSIYYISLPALIITLFSNIEFTQSTLGFFGFHAGIVIILSFVLVGLLSLFPITNKTKIAVVLGAMVGNTVYMGYPILSTAYPQFPIEVAMGAGTIQLIVGLLVGVFLIEYFVLKTKKLSVYFTDLARDPLAIAVVVGTLLSFIPQSTLGDISFNIISLIGTTASPLALLSLGMFMSRTFSKQSWILGGFAILAKLLILPLCIFFIATFFGYSTEFIQISVLIFAMPTAVTSFVLAQKYHLNEHLIADTVLASTVVSIVSIPIIVLLLG